ncbi:MAG: hypothetical protein NW220_17855 [Leptolyngbyaceae cyanobacterium bins.349]|nr:hypothetical protein [Leptolyngbyaceae cyanobacterium bins.349]
MNYSPSLGVPSTLTPKQIFSQYVASLSDQKVILDLQNAVVRYFIPSVDGPVPTAQKGRPLSAEDISTALDFLDIVSLEALSNAPDLALSTLEKLGISTMQKERVRRSLRDLIDWALAHGYLNPPETPIPEGICHTIKVGRYAALPLRRASVRQICEEYLAHSSDSSQNTTDTWNAIVRFFVPGCGGPIPLHKPAREFEVQAALTYLETVPLEYFDEALSITTQVMDALQISQTQQTRMRRTLKELLQWARKWRYLPQPYTVTPWGQPCGTGTSLPSIPSDPTQAQTLKDYYDRYYQQLESNNQKPTLDLWQAAVIRYFVPACGGPCPSGKTVTHAEVHQSNENPPPPQILHLGARKTRQSAQTY